MTKKDEEEKPFKVILSREQLTFLKELKLHLMTFLETAKLDEEPDDDTIKMQYIIEAVFTLPVAEQNIFLIKEFAAYPSVTKLAEELQITKQTLCAKIRKIKTYIKKYVDNKLSNTRSSSY